MNNNPCRVTHYRVKYKHDKHENWFRDWEPKFMSVIPRIGECIQFEHYEEEWRCWEYEIFRVKDIIHDFSGEVDNITLILCEESESV